MANIMMLHMFTGFASANRQWGHLTANNSTGKIILPISANAVVCILQHYGVSPQYNGIDNSGVVYSSFKEEEEIRFIAITK